VFDEEEGEWELVTTALDNGTGVDTTDTMWRGRAYAGYVWADLDHLSLFGVGGHATTELGPVIANAGGNVEIDVFEGIHLNGNLSTGNGPIDNFTWTMGTGNGTETQYGPEFLYTFDVPGQYEVSLTVRDGFGLTAIDTALVTVNDVWVLDVGPVRDEEGKEVADALVTLDDGDYNESGTTDATGRLELALNVSWIGANVTVRIEKDGFVTGTLKTNITRERHLADGMPVLKKKAPPNEFTLKIGPITGKDGVAIEGAFVRVTVCGGVYETYTNYWGNVSFVLPRTCLGLDATVVVQKSGYKKATHVATITDDGTLEVPLPPMKKVAKPTTDYSLYVVLAVIVVLVVSLLVGFYMLSKQKGKKEGPDDGEEEINDGPDRTGPAEGPEDLEDEDVTEGSEEE